MAAATIILTLSALCAAWVCLDTPPSRMEEFKQKMKRANPDDESRDPVATALQDLRDLRP